MLSHATIVATSILALGALVTPGHRAPLAEARPQGAASTAATPLWHVEGHGWGRPAADASTVYFLTRDHEVEARDGLGGALRWRARTGESGPTTEGSTVVLAGDVAITGDYNVVAFDRRDGALRWRFTPTDGYAPGMYLGEAAGDLVFAGSPSGRLYAIDHRTGTARWSYLVEDDGKTTVYEPVSDGDAVVAGFTTFTAPNVGGVVLLDAASGRERWRTSFPRPADVSHDSGSAGGPVLLEDEVLAASAEGIVYAFDRRTGSVRWTLPRWSTAAPTPADPRERDFRPLARAGQRLLVGSLSGDVIAYDLRDRAERWRYTSARNGSIAFRMASDDRTVFVPYVDGCLVALDAEDGRERWRTSDAFTGFIWPPAIARDRVFAADAEGGFFAFAR